MKILLTKIHLALVEKYCTINYFETNFEEKNIMQTSNKSIEASEIVRNNMLYAMGAGMIPFPFADMVAVSALQLNMIRQLAGVYEIPFEEAQGKALISALSGSIVSKVGARTLVKLIPGVGSLLGGVAMGVVSGASTYALGQAFKLHFSIGGNLTNFDTKKMKDYYDEQFEKGKKVAEDLKKAEEEKKNTTNETKSSAEKLKEVAELHKNGILNDAEFEELKKKILSEYV